MEKLVAGIVSPKSNYVLMPDGSFASPGRYKTAWQFDDKQQAAAELAKHLPVFAKSEARRTKKKYIVNGEFYVPLSAFEATGAGV